MNKFTIKWPRNLSIFDMNRLVRAKRSCTIPDELARLSQKNIKMAPDEAYELIRQIESLSEQLGFYVLDSSEKPEQLNPQGELPTCVLTAQAATYVDVNDMSRILVLYYGSNLPAYLSEDERQRLIRASRQKPVLVTYCRREGCGKKIVVTVAMAAQAIIKYKLIEKGGIYEPSTFCLKCRTERDAMRATQSAPKKHKEGLAVPLGQLAKWINKNKQEVAGLQTTLAGQTQELLDRFEKKGRNNVD